LALDESVQKQGEQDADQRADQEERDRDLPSKTHPPATLPKIPLACGIRRG
jgi:hypothetical protein